MMGDDLSLSLATLAARLAEHYVAPPTPLCIDLHVGDSAAIRRRFVMAASIEMAEPDALDVAPVACITLGASVLKTLLAEPATFDPRSAAILAKGGLQVKGNARVAAYWLQLLKRPSDAGQRALARALDRAPRTLSEVACIDAREQPDWMECLGDALGNSTPLRVTGAIDWPEINWTLKEWREREGNVALRMDPSTGRAQTVASFIDTLLADTTSTNETSYTDGCLLPPAWDARFRIDGLPQSMFGPAQLWFGRGRADRFVTRLHCDIENSFLAQVHGRKRVRLYSPSQARNVYALDAFNTYRPCRVDAGAPDLARFPLFAEAKFVDTLIEPGDVLIIPTGWFHCVWALAQTLSVSRFVADDAFVLARAEMVSR